MYSNEYMYAIERDPEYLAHYGIKGMRWGVRKAILSGNGKRLGRQYAKAAKKLAKLEKRAAKADKYKKRAIGMGIGAAAAGGLAAAGTSGVANASRFVGRAGHTVMDAAGRGMINVGNKMKLSKIRGGGRLATAGLALRNASTSVGLAGRKAGFAIDKWGKGDSLSRAIRRPMINAAVANGGNVAGKGINAAQGALRGVSNNTIARIGAGAIGAGLAAGAARNAYKAATAQKKAAAWRREMNDAFKGTQYANGGRPRQGKKRRRG